MDFAMGDQDPLENYRYLRLVTFRKDGSPVACPMWYARSNRQLYLSTYALSAKVKRIRANPRVEVGICDRRGKPLGPSVSGVSHIAQPGTGEARRAQDLLRKRYGWQSRLAGLLMRLLGKQERAFIVIELQPEP